MIHSKGAHVLLPPSSVDNRQNSDTAAGRRERALDIVKRLDLRPMIGGAPAEASGSELPVIDPATGELIATVPAAGAREVDAAANMARETFDGGQWSRASAVARAKVLWRLAELMEAAAEDLALLEVLDNGKPLRDAARIDIPQSAAHFRYQAAAVMRLEGSAQAPSASNGLTYLLPEPVGVVAAITPWNFPLIMASRVIAPALAAGNSVILKPSEETPLTALFLASLASDAGLPAGVLSVLPGYGEQAGRALSSHQDVDHIAFTGGHEAARELIQNSAVRFQRLTLELGGKSPALVLPDAEINEALPGLIVGAFSNQGQNCCAATRILVDAARKSELIEGLACQARELALGSGFADSTDLGPLVSEAHLARVASIVAQAERAGAEIVTGGHRPDGSLGAGSFYEPTILDRVESSQPVAKDEVFGPVVIVDTYEDLDEGIAKANATEYGLAAGIWTRDLDKAHAVARRLNAGTVWINCYERFDAAVPFAGRKQSGYGNSVGGHRALEEFTVTKTVWVEP